MKLIKSLLMQAFRTIIGLNGCCFWPFVSMHSACINGLISVLAITSTGTKKWDLLLADVSTKLTNKNVTTDVKVDTNSNLLTIITVDEPAPGLKAIFNFCVPDQRSGKVEPQHLYE